MLVYLAAAAAVFVIVQLVDEPRRNASYKAATLEAIRAISPRAYSVAIMDRVREATGLRISTARLYLALGDLE